MCIRDSNNVGHVIDQDGSSIKTISGIRPQDIAFNSDQTEALFVGSDDDIYLAYLNEDELTVRITQNTNNEWYSDPEFISDDNKILYAQRKHFSNNNVGTINLYTMDRDGKNKTQITDAVGEEKFILPRMSPSGDKIIYYFKNVGLYELNYPNEKRGAMVSTLGGDSIIPEITSYFRNIKWSPNGEKAIIWEKKFNSTYNLYVYDKNKKIREINANIIFLRHAIAPGFGDPEDFNLKDCETQRNLSEDGVKQSKILGNVIFFICGHMLHGLMNSTFGFST